MIDRYTKVVLTLIACALVYLSVILTPFPRAHAQVPSRTPGEPSGPSEVVIVGYKDRAPLPVIISGLVELSQPVRVTGSVTTERSSDRADRVILVGWEENAVRNKAGQLRQLGDFGPYDPGARGLPVKLPK